MRKALTILLAALVLFSALFTIAHVAVNNQKELVTWQEQILYGDRSLAAGAVVRTTNHFRRHLLWETTGVLGEELHPSTTFSFTNDTIEIPYETTYEGLHLEHAVEFLAALCSDTHDRMPEYAKEKYADLIAYCESCYHSVEIGQEKFFTLDLANYMDYYSLSGIFDFPDSYWSHFDEFGNHGGQIQEETIRAINDFFRIPILGEYVVEWSVNRHQYGSSVGTSYAGGAKEVFYQPEFDAVYLNDTCYLTFNAVADSGEVADTSLIPGGYGLYRLNISRDDAGELVFGDPIAEMVYPMDPSIKFGYLDVSDDGRHIYLHTWEGSRLMRTILDVQTMEQLQTIQILDQKEDFYRSIKQYDDFLVITMQSINNAASGENSISVFSEDAQGLYHHRFTVPMNLPGLTVDDDLGIFCSVTEHMDFNGETLLVTQNEFRNDKPYSYGDNPDFYVLAYRAEGLSYVGKYSVNLTDIRTDEEKDSCLVNPVFDIPVQVSW